MDKNGDGIFPWYIMAMFNSGSFSLIDALSVLAFAATYREKKVSNQTKFNCSTRYLPTVSAALLLTTY